MKGYVKKITYNGIFFFKLEKFTDEETNEKFIEIKFWFETSYWDFQKDCQTTDIKKSWFGGQNAGKALPYKHYKLSEIKHCIIQKFCELRFPQPVNILSKLYLQYLILTSSEKIKAK